MARWLPATATFVAVIALGVALFRPPDVPPVTADDLWSVQQDVNAAAAAADALSDRVADLERAAAAARETNVVAELGSVRDEMDNIAAGLGNACSAIGDLSSRIDDVWDSVDGSSVYLPPSIGGRC